MRAKTATVIGATGLIGSHLVELLQSDGSFDQIRLLVRKVFQNKDPKTLVRLIDFNDPESFRLGIEGSDVVFCAIGTTQKKMEGNQDNYRKVDHDIAVRAGEMCKLTGCFNFAVVSAVGASAQSNNFYLKLKGQTEEDLKKINIPSTSIFRPSLLLGQRKEFRIGERLAQVIVPMIAPVLAGKWRKYKPVEAKEVARAMIKATNSGLSGFHIYEYDGILNLLKN
ncbi:MAG: oxidoreductase [Flavisolibacter sp.]